MKKRSIFFFIAMLLLILCVSCENGVDALAFFGKNICGSDTSGVDEMFQKVVVKSVEVDDLLQKFQLNNVKLKKEHDDDNLKIVFQDQEGTLPDYTIEIGSYSRFLCPGASLSEIAEMLESNAGSALAEKLDAPLKGEELHAVAGTLGLINGSVSASVEALGGKDSKLGSMATKFKVTTKNRYTKADALVLQGMMNLVFGSIEEIMTYDYADADSVNVIIDDIVSEIVDNLMVLKTLSDKTNSSYKMDFGAIIDFFNNVTK